MKKQIKFQKVLFIVTLVIAALTLIYGFAYCTGALSYAFKVRSGMFDNPSTEVNYRNDPIKVDALYRFVMGQEYVNGRWVKTGTIGFNDLIVLLGIVFVVLAALQFFFATNNRRKYYITNYISVAAITTFAIVIAAVALWGIVKSEALFNQMDWVRYKDVYDRVKAGTAMGWSYYSDSHVMFILGYVLFSFVLVDAVVLALNTVWKVLLMKGENALLSKNMNTTEVKEVCNEKQV